MAVSDDFSFPKLVPTTTATTTTTTSTCVAQFSVSTPSQAMWRVSSSLIFPHNTSDEEEASAEATAAAAVQRKHKSFSELEIGDSETRMDLLWQDFNERELKRVSSLDGRVKPGRSLSRSGSSTGSTSASMRRTTGSESLPDRHCFAPGLNLFRGPERRSSLAIRTRRRTSTVLFFRALRKLFSAHSLGREKKKE